MLLGVPQKMMQSHCMTNFTVNKKKKKAERLVAQSNLWTLEWLNGLQIKLGEWPRRKL